MKDGRKRGILEYGMTLWFILTLNFFLPRLIPGDPFLFLSTEDGDFTAKFSAAQIEHYQAYYGLDKPLYEQYFAYLQNLVRGDLGYSIYYNNSVAAIIRDRVGWTIGIAGISLVFSCALGTLLGCISAWKRGKRLDRFLYVIMIAFSEIPPFLVGILLLFIFGAQLGWFPLAGGRTALARLNSPGALIMDLVLHAVLPVITLTMSKLGSFYLLARNSMLTVLAKDYIRTARAKGLGNLYVALRHALKNALLPIITRIFLSLGSIFGGAVLVENVFNYPGIGRLLRETVMTRDYPLLQGIFLFFAIAVLGMNFLADRVYRKLDPRVEEENVN
jgi:peptide/nickel transport system permease protein